jgi:homogentisate 1,2-dioxygenase
MSSNIFRRRHVPLGERLDAAERIRAGEITLEEVAASHGIEPAEVERWLASEERPMTVADVLATPEERRLTRRAEQLVRLIASSDALIGALTELLVARRPRDDFA